MASVPTLLRRRGRRGFRRLVYLSAVIAMLLAAPGSSGAPNDHLHITPVIFGTLGANGWYISNVTVNYTFDAVPPVLATEGCEFRTLTADTPGTRLICKARNDPFDTEPYEWTTISDKTFRVDKTPPAVSPILERQADSNGWYNRPLTIAFAGTDATSQIALCTSGRYAGPDNGAALIAGSCSDNAGNIRPTSVPFRYDATPPTLFAVTARPGNRSAQISWRKSTDTQVVEVFRAPGRRGQGESGVYRGSATGFLDRGLNIGRRYEYRVVAVDEAANRAEHKFNLVATGPLLSPFPGAKVTGPPALAWTAVKRASYYNIQLIRNGRRVLSAWPDRPSFRLRRTWLYRGRRYRLRPGVYRWYVWPGFGRISAARYTERPLGSSSFVVTS